ncbi:MAG: hypothetical protein AAF847_03590 [Bacteroidota bacterium]
MNSVATIPFSFTAILQAEAIRESFIDCILQIEAKLLEEIDFSVYGSSLEHISCCFVLVPESQEEEESGYEEARVYLEAEKEIFLQILLNYDEFISLEQDAYFEHLAKQYQQAFEHYETFGMEEFAWEALLEDIETVFTVDEEGEDDTEL